jgi:hypothetical protein
MQVAGLDPNLRVVVDIDGDGSALTQPDEWARELIIVECRRDHAVGRHFDQTNGDPKRVVGSNSLVSGGWSLVPTAASVRGSLAGRYVDAFCSART